MFHSACIFYHDPCMWTWISCASPPLSVWRGESNIFKWPFPPLSEEIKFPNYLPLCIDIHIKILRNGFFIVLFMNPCVKLKQMCPKMNILICVEYLKPDSCWLNFFSHKINLWNESIFFIHSTNILRSLLNMSYIISFNPHNNMAM